MKVVVLGPQRSGTNYVENLLKNNFKEINIVNQDSKYLWKHRAIPADVKDKLDESVIHFAIHKNPYKWVESIMKYNADLDKRWGGNKGQYSELYFDPKEGDIIVDDRRGRKTNLSGSCRLWNDFYNNWSAENKVKIHFIRYEDLLVKDKREEILKSWIQLGLHRKDQRNWENPTKVGQSDKWNDEMTKRYLDLEHFNKLNQEHIDMVNKYIDRKWFNQFNYPFIEKKGWDINKRKKELRVSPRETS